MEESHKKSRKRKSKKGKGKKRTKGGGDTGASTESKKRKIEPSPISQKSRPKMNSTDGNKVPPRVRKFWAMRHIVGSCIEGIAEYCRIAYDLLLEDGLISVISVGNTINRINNWHEDQQQISQILSRFSGTKSVQKTNIKKGLEMAVKCLVEPLPQRHTYEPPSDGLDPMTGNPVPILNRTRIICIFQDQQEGKNMNDSVYSAYQTGSGTLHLLETVSNLIEKENAHITNLNMNTSATAGECGQTIDHCDIVFITIVPATYFNILPPSSSMKLSDKITIETNFITPALVKDAFIDLAVSHFNLAAIRITQIPIQGKKKKSTVKPPIPVIEQEPVSVISPLQANEKLGEDNEEVVPEEKEEQYNVELLYHNADSIMVLQTLTHHGHVLGTSSFWRIPSRMIEAKWCPLPLKLDTDTLPSLSVHRITPHARTSLPTVTLIKWIFQGNPVLLTYTNHPENIQDKESEFPQYMLMVHGGNIYLHKLYNDQLDLSMVIPPGFNEKEDKCFCIYDTNNNISKTLEGLRQQEFLDMTRDNQLSYCDPSQAQRMRIFLKHSVQALPKGSGTPCPGGGATGGMFSYMSTTCLDRLTRVFPLRIHDTVLFDLGTHTEKMQEILKPLHMLLVRDELQGSEFKGALECISRLHQNAKSNSALLFPSDVSSDIRQQRYVRLWQELRTLAEKHQKNSKNHKKILSNMDTLWPEMVQQQQLSESSNVPSTTIPGATATTASVTGTTGINVSGTEEDPNQYRLIPQHAQGREETGEDVKNDMNIDPGVLRPDLVGFEQPYAAKRHTEDLLPSVLETKDPHSLFYKYWKNAEVKQESFIFDGYK